MIGVFFIKENDGHLASMSQLLWKSNSSVFLQHTQKGKKEKGKKEKGKKKKEKKEKRKRKRKKKRKKNYRRKLSIDPQFAHWAEKCRSRRGLATAPSLLHRPQTESPCHGGVEWGREAIVMSYGGGGGHVTDSNDAGYFSWRTQGLWRSIMAALVWLEHSLFLVWHAWRSCWLAAIATCISYLLLDWPLPTCKLFNTWRTLGIHPLYGCHGLGGISSLYINTGSGVVHYHSLGELSPFLQKKGKKCEKKERKKKEQKMWKKRKEKMWKMKERKKWNGE